MEKVTIFKSELIKVLKENRKKHKEIYDEAFEGYKEKVILLLKKKYNDIKNGKEILLSFNLQQPINKTKDYDRAIKMMEMSIDEKITLTEEDFSRYILDEWHWKNNFLMSNMQYTKMK